MHVKAKKMAVAGLVAAFSAVMMILSSIVETSSLFFIAAASFCVGITIREWGVNFGAGFLVASSIVNFFVAPNKFYCFTFVAMGAYILVREWLWEKIATKENIKNRNLMLWIGKYVIFNCIYVPAIVFFQEMIFGKLFSNIGTIMVFLAGQAGLFVFDKAYLYFQGFIWGKLRGKLIMR